MLVLFLMGASVALAQAVVYHVGRPATLEEIRARDISVAPDGKGLPSGHGNVASGRRIYQSQCSGCHGSHGEGAGNYPPLVGGRGTLATSKPLLTVGSYWPYATTVWDFIRRAMPYQEPGSLSPDQTYSLTAFILFLNGIVGDQTELNEQNLARIRMPNRDGFVPDPRPDIR